jgi:TatD DNase family protein
MIDTHCHLDLSIFDDDRADVLARARAAGVSAIVVPGIRPDGWAALRAVCTAGAQPALALAIGVHPQVVPELSPDERLLALDPERLAQAARAAGAVAIGECGLDGGTADLDEQERILRAHVRAARLCRLPVILHVLRAHDAAPRILREERISDVGGVLHSYSGGAALVPVYQALGLCFSLAGPVTYEGARRPVEAARAIPAHLLLAETDAPDQSPEPHRGTRCEPAFVADVVRGLARARGVEEGEIARVTAENARRLFGLG